MTIRQAEIWLVTLDPTVGDEIRKTRPCLVIGDDTIGKLRSKTIVPITGWDERYGTVPWMIPCPPDEHNGLEKLSALDAFQIRNLSTRRFLKRLGRIDDALLFRVHTAVAKTLSIRYRLVRE